jgi:subtilisin family serine protease
MRTAAGVLVLAAVVGVGAPAAATPGPSDAPEYWFDTWHVSSLWQSGARGQGITIAEIDTGVNAEIPELRGRVLDGTDLGAGGNGQTDRQIDSFGHGTGMASIMVARPGVLGITGLAPAAKILPIAVPLGGTTTEDKPDEVPQAIRYAARHGADIISMSLGGNRSPSLDVDPCPDEEQAAIYYALRKGALVIASVGNTGPTQNTIQDPGVCLGVISVGAVDEGGQVASFSAREPYLTLVAPGVNIPSLGRLAGQAFAGEGTSQATAITSAVAALVWSAHPELGAAGVAARLIDTVDDPQRPPSQAYGYGLLNGYRAVTADVPADAPNPVYDAVRPFLDRVHALRRAAPTARAAPPAAGTRPLPVGSYEVGSRPALSTQVALGIALAVVGLLVAGGSGLAALRTAGARPAPVRPRPGPVRQHPRPYPRPRPGTAAARPQPHPPPPPGTARAGPQPRAQRAAAASRVPLD